MTPEQEDNMRKQIADYTKGEFIDLAIQLQNTVDHNVTKIRGLESSQEQMGKQIPQLLADKTLQTQGVPFKIKGPMDSPTYSFY